MNNLQKKIKESAARAVALKNAGMRISWGSVKSSHPNNKFSGELSRSFSSLFASRFSLKEQVFFAKRLSFLINAGVPLVESLTVLEEQTTTRGHTAILGQIINDTSNGQALSRSFAKFPKIFSEFAVHIIRIGEQSGTLSQNLSYLADELKKRSALRKKVIGAFIYPALITLATLGITAFLMLYLFPKIMPIFSSLHATLPLSTRIVMFLSIFLSQWGFYVIGAAFLLVVLILFILKRSNTSHYYFDFAAMKIPMLGRVMISYNVANAARTAGLLLKSGITLSEALPIVADTTKNLVYKHEFKALSQVVTRGEKISTQLRRRRKLFPDIFSHMIAVGERSGTLSETLVYLSEMYEAEVDDFTKNLSTLIEPALMVFMGILVGFVAISIITPIYGITQNLHN